MSQFFAAFGVEWPLLIAQVVNFSIVLVALWYFLYKPVMSMLSARKERVEKSVREAAEIGDLFAQADGQAAERVRAADTEAEQIVTSAREAATATQAQIVKDAEARAQHIAKDAEVRAAEAVAHARRESEKDVARLAILAAEKIMKSHA